MVGVSPATALVCLAFGLARQKAASVAIAAGLLAMSAATAAGAAWRRCSSWLAAAVTGSRLPRVRRRDLPGGTYVRDAVVLACPTGTEGDAAVRFAVREAELRPARLVVVASYVTPVDPDLESIETPEAELRRRARARAEATLCRALSRATDQLPAHEIVTEPGPPSFVLLRGYAGAQLIVVAAARHGLLARFGVVDADGAALVRRSRSPVVLVPCGPPAADGSHERLP